jgi:O-methyltransferase domain
MSSCLGEPGDEIPTPQQHTGGDQSARDQDGVCSVLKNIIHDWDDERAREILASCRRAMGAGEAVLLVIEHVVRPTEQSYRATISDVQMLVRTGGRNRTEQELEALLTVSGFRVRRTIPTAGGPDIVEASPTS